MQTDDAKISFSASEDALSDAASSLSGRFGSRRVRWLGENDDPHGLLL